MSERPDPKVDLGAACGWCLLLLAYCITLALAALGFVTGLEWLTGW